MGQEKPRQPGQRTDSGETTLGGPRAPRGTAGGRAPLGPGARLGPYEILSRLGAGGMGEVYRARDARLGREVAIKVLPAEWAADPERSRRFEREARAASALNHPNIVTVHEIDDWEGRRSIVMELVSGRTLRALDLPLPVASLASLGGQIAQALAAAHAAGIVHRDLKPENIMVRDDGYVKLLDFGLARLDSRLPAATPGPGESGTLPGALLGTPPYMSPEQARGDSVDGATDVFSAGIVFYELAAGRHPFEADPPVAVLSAILTRDPVAPSRLNPAVPPALDELLLGMLQKDPRMRPAAREVEAALAAVARGAAPPVPRRAVARPGRPTVGRESERRALHSALDDAAAGQGLLVCVSGEPGIGKTTLVEEFLAELAASGSPCAVARGRCSERLAGAEAYLPVLEALDSLLTGGGEGAAHALQVLAPTWYAQVTGVVGGEKEAARAGSSQRLVRELSAFVQELTRLRPLVLFLDDVHWADPSTVDLLAYLATRFGSLRTLVVATYRPSELLLGRHPFLGLKLDLQGRGACREFPLEFLGPGEVDAYLALEFPGHRFPPTFGALVYEKTEGSPLFMVDLLRYLRGRAIVEEGGSWGLAGSLSELERELPESVRSVIQRKIDRVGDAGRRLLLAAAVQGHECDSAVLARALGTSPAQTEERLDDLERVHSFVRRMREEDLPDGTPTLRYRFVHVLYQNALYDSLTPARRAELSAAVAGALLHYSRDRTDLVASRLAFLFEAARDRARASGFFLLAARGAARVFAYGEAAVLAERGLRAARGVPEGPERARSEAGLEIALGGLCIVTKGGADPEVERHYLRARALAAPAGDGPEVFTALRGLSEHYHESARLEIAVGMAEQALAVAGRLGSPTLLVDAHHAVAMPLIYLGRLAEARDHLAEGVRLYSPEQDRGHGSLYQAIDPGVGCRYQSARTSWLLGFPEQALAQIEEGVALADRIGHAYSAAQIHVAGAFVRQFRREPRRAREHAETAIAVSREHGFEQVAAQGTAWHGWAVAAEGRIDEGMAEMQGALSAPGIVAHKAMRPHLLGLVVEALWRSGRFAEGLATVAEALAVSESGGRYYRAELLRWRGELLIARAADGAGRVGTAEAEDCFARALEVARAQGAKGLELRVATSLARLWRQQRKESEAHALLAGVYGGFTEGFETPDLQEARALLEEIA
jgi:predicted ATPase